MGLRHESRFDASPTCFLGEGRGLVVLEASPIHALASTLPPGPEPATRARGQFQLVIRHPCGPRRLVWPHRVSQVRQRCRFEGRRTLQALLSLSCEGCASGGGP
jgi:hypothetical protein